MKLDFIRMTEECIYQIDNMKISAKGMLPEILREALELAINSYATNSGVGMSVDEKKLILQIHADCFNKLQLEKGKRFFKDEAKNYLKIYFDNFKQSLLENKLLASESIVSSIPPVVTPIVSVNKKPEITPVTDSSKKFSNEEEADFLKKIIKKVNTSRNDQNQEVSLAGKTTESTDDDGRREVKIRTFNTSVNAKDYQQSHIDSQLIIDICNAMSKVRTELVEISTTHPDSNALNADEWQKMHDKIGENEERVQVNVLMSLSVLRNLDNNNFSFNVDEDNNRFVEFNMTNDVHIDYLKHVVASTLDLKIANCEGLCMITHMLLLQANPEMKIQYFELTGAYSNLADHVVLVINSNSNNCREWDENVIICDPLEGQLYFGNQWKEVKNYDRIKEQMVVKTLAENQTLIPYDVYLQQKNYKVPLLNVDEFKKPDDNMQTKQAQKDLIEYVLNTNNPKDVFLLSTIMGVISNCLNNGTIRYDDLMKFKDRVHDLHVIFFRPDINRLAAYINLSHLFKLDSQQIETTMKGLERNLTVNHVYRNTLYLGQNMVSKSSQSKYVMTPPRDARKL